MLQQEGVVGIKKTILIACILLVVGLICSLGFYSDLYTEYENLKNQEPKKEIVYVEKEVEVIKEVPVYTEASTMSERDFFLLCQLIYYEAGSPNTSNLDRTLAGNVSLNRLGCSYRGAKSLEDVIYAKGQYSTSGKITDNEHISIPMSSVLAAYRLAIGNRYCPSNVIYQSQSKQGDGVWQKVGHHYYCYENDIEVSEYEIIQEFVE